MGADLVQLVHGAHDLPGLLAHAVHGVEAVEDLAVVDLDLELGQAKLGKGIVNDGGDLGLVEDVQLPVADHVDIRLIEFPEAAPLGPLAPVDLADLVAPEGKGQLAVVGGDVFGQGHGQIKAQCQIAVPLLEAVDLLFGLAAALGQQHLRRFDDRGIQGREAVEGVALPQHAHHPLHLHLIPGGQLHKAGEGPGRDFCHRNAPIHIECAGAAARRPYGHIYRFWGLTMLRQSRSPRRRPCTSTSAVAALVAKGI